MPSPLHFMAPDYYSPSSCAAGRQADIIPTYAHAFPPPRALWLYSYFPRSSDSVLFVAMPAYRGALVYALVWFKHALVCHGGHFAGAVLVHTPSFYTAFTTAYRFTPCGSLFHTQPTHAFKHRRQSSSISFHAFSPLDTFFFSITLPPQRLCLPCAVAFSLPFLSSLDRTITYPTQYRSPHLHHRDATNPRRQRDDGLMMVSRQAEAGSRQEQAGQGRQAGHHPSSTAWLHVGGEASIKSPPGLKQTVFPFLEENRASSGLAHAALYTPVLYAYMLFPPCFVTWWVICSVVVVT